MSESLYYKGVLSYKLQSFLFFLILFLNFYAPNLGGRDYIGIIFIYLFFILLIVNRIVINRLTLFIIFYTFYIITIDVYSLFTFPQSVSMIARTIIYNSIPLIAFIIGTYFKGFLSKSTIKKSIIFIGVLQAFIGIGQVYSDFIRNWTLRNYTDFEKYITSFETWNLGRVVGTIGNPNTYGVFIGIISIFVLFDILKEKVYKKMLLRIAILSILVYSIILSQSRTGFVILILGIIIVIFLNNNNLIFKTFTFLILFVVLGYLLLFNDLVGRRFQSENTFTLGGRILIWKNYIESYLTPIRLENLIGYGYYFVRDINKAVDNYYLQIILQYGLIGLLIYTSLFVYVLKSFLLKIAESRDNIVIFSITLMLLISDFLGTINMSPDIMVFYFIVLGFFYNNFSSLKEH